MQSDNDAEGEYEFTVQREAMHEAGHAVVAWSLGLDVVRVGLTEHEEHDCNATSVSPWQRAISAAPSLVEKCCALQRMILVCLAGPVCEGIFCGETKKVVYASADFWRSLRLLNSIFDSGAEKSRAGEMLISQARNLLKDNWSGVNRVANGILKNRWLYSQGLTEILGPRPLRRDDGQVAETFIPASFADSIEFRDGRMRD